MRRKIHHWLKKQLPVFSINDLLCSDSSSWYSFIFKPFHLVISISSNLAAKDDPLVDLLTKKLTNQPYLKPSKTKNTQQHITNTNEITSEGISKCFDQSKERQADSSGTSTKWQRAVKSGLMEETSSRPRADMQFRQNLRIRIGGQQDITIGRQYEVQDVMRMFILHLTETRFWRSKIMQFLK